MICPTLVPCSGHSRPTRALSAALLLCAGMASAGTAEAATRIYRTVDEHGNVGFTDVPPKSEEQGQAVDLNQGSSFQPPEQPGSSRSLESWLGTEDQRSEKEPNRGYTSLSVASPAGDGALRDNAGNVTVVADLAPDLHPDHVLQLYLDGELAQSSRTPVFQLVNVDRGTHQIELRVVDAAGNTLAASEPSTFHLQRRSAILQPAGRARAN